MTKPAPKVGATVSVARSSAQHAPVGRVPGHAQRAQAKGPAVRRAVIRRATTARRHVVMPQRRVREHRIAPVAL